MTYTKEQYTEAEEYLISKFCGKTIYHGHPIPVTYEALRICLGQHPDLVVVPREPTMKMMDSLDAVYNGLSYKDAYKDMIQAAQEEIK